MRGRRGPGGALAAEARSWLAAQESSSQWRPLWTIDPLLATSVVLAEDVRFLEHAGVDLGALWRVVRARRAGTGEGGAGTIPMQTARVLRTSRRASLGRKLHETMLAPALVARHGREAVLEAYLNVADFSAATIGAQAGARDLLDRDADDVGLFGATLLAAALPAPDLRPGDDPWMTRRVARIQVRLLSELVLLGAVDAAAAAAARTEIRDRWGDKAPA